MNEELMAKIKAKLKEAGVSVVAYGVCDIGETEESMRKVFNFARSMGIKTIVTEPADDDFTILEKLVKEYDIAIAIHNHPAPSKYNLPETEYLFPSIISYLLGSARFHDPGRGNHELNGKGVPLDVESARYWCRCVKRPDKEEELPLAPSHLRWRLVYRKDAILAGCPERQDRCDACDATLLVLARKNQSIGVGDEMQMVENAPGLRSLDPAMPEVNLVDDHRLMPSQEFPKRDEVLSACRVWSAELEKVSQILIPQPGEPTIAWFEKVSRPCNGKPCLRSDPKAWDDWMKIKNRLNGCLVPIIPFVMNPCFPQVTPGENRENIFLLAVKNDELSFFFFDGRHPVTPFLHAQQDRNTAAEIRYELLSGLLRFEAPDKPEVTAETMRCFGKLEFIGTVPPASADNFSDLVFISQDAKRNKGMLQGKRSALPPIGLRIESH